MENNIKTIDEIKVLLESKDYKEDEIKEFVGFVEPFYDFYEYMLKEHEMSYDDVESDSSIFSQEVFPEYLEKVTELESPMEYMVEISGDIMKRYAAKYGYSEPEKVKIALTKYMELLVMNEMTKK